MVINSFLVSFFAFVNSFFYMPTRLLHFVEHQFLFFMSQVAFTPLGVFAHLRKLYGITTEPRDLRLSNITSLLATYIHNPRNKDQLHLSISYLRVEQIRNAHPRRGRVADRLEHPTNSWICAWAYFNRVVDENPDEVYEASLPSADRRAALDLQLPSIQRALYGSLCRNEFPAWRAFLAGCVHARGWNSAAFLRGLDVAQKGLPQAQRWHLFKLHLNGHMTTARLHAARQAPAILQCSLCGNGPDHISHYFTCATVRTAFGMIEGARAP